MIFSKIPAYLIDSENVGSTWISLLQTQEKFELFICVTENAKNLNFTLLKQLTSDNKHKINIIECKPGKNSLDFYLSSYLGYLIGKNHNSSYVVVSQDTGYDAVIEYWQNEGYDVKRINTKPDTPKKTVRKTSEKTKAKKAAPKTEEKADSEVRVIKKDTSKEKAKKETKAVETKKETTVKKTNKKKETPKQKPVETKPKDVSVDEAGKLLEELLKETKEIDVNEVKKYLDKVPKEKQSDKNYIYRGLVRKFKSEKGLATYTAIKKDLDKYYELSEKSS